MTHPRGVAGYVNLQLQIDDPADADALDSADVLHDVLAFDRDHASYLHFLAEELVVELSDSLNLVDLRLRPHHLGGADCLSRVDTAADDGHDFRGHRPRIGVAGQLVDRAVWLGGELSHCGSDSYDLDEIHECIGGHGGGGEAAYGYGEEPLGEKFLHCYSLCSKDGPNSGAVSTVPGVCT